MSKPFEDIETTSKSKVELKKPGSKSIFDAQPVKSVKAQQEEFRARASDVNDRFNSYNERAIDAVSSFMKLLEDQTLTNNKSVFASEVEQEIINKFQTLALDMDGDDLQPNGMGSVGVITFLLKVALIQRDKINQLDFNLNQINNKVKSIALQHIDKQSDKK